MKRIIAAVALVAGIAGGYTLFSKSSEKTAVKHLQTETETYRAGTIDYECNTLKKYYSQFGLCPNALETLMYNLQDAQ